MMVKAPWGVKVRDGRDGAQCGVEGVAGTFTDACLEFLVDPLMADGSPQQGWHPSPYEKMPLLTLPFGNMPGPRVSVSAQKPMAILPSAIPRWSSLSSQAYFVTVPERLQGPFENRPDPISWTTPCPCGADSRMPSAPHGQRRG
jgi:hypothetical protein